jgi:putative tricarboxylic transport membrane protein
MFAFGVFGYVLNRYGFSVPIFLMAFILGDIGESAFLRSMLLFDNDFSQFFVRPISGTLMGLSILVVVWVIATHAIRFWRRSRASLLLK